MLRDFNHPAPGQLEAARRRRTDKLHLIEWLAEPPMQLFSWDEVTTEIMNPKIKRKVITGERAMVAQVFIAKGGVVPEHRHESEQLTYIMEGALEFELEGRTVVVRKGEVLHIPSNVPHR